MAQLTPEQIAYYAYRAGFRGDALNQAVAIALAESGGRVEAYNPELAAGTKSGSGSRGLWQIYGTAHPWANNSQVFDPQVNANAAFRVFKEAGNRFSPWSTWNAGVRATKDYSKLNFANMSMPKVKINPVQQVARGSVNPITTKTQNNTSGPLQNVKSSAGDASKPATLRSFLGLPESNSESGPNTPLDITFITIGGALILIGVLGLLFMGYASANVATGKAIMKNASKIAPAIL